MDCLGDKDTEHKTNLTCPFFRQSHGSKTMTNQSSLTSTYHMKVIDQNIIHTFLHRQLIKKIQTFLIHFF